MLVCIKTLVWLFWLELQVFEIFRFNPFCGIMLSRTSSRQIVSDFKKAESILVLLVFCFIYNGAAFVNV